MLPDRIIIDENNHGRRLDSLVRQFLPGISLGTIMKWLRRGTIRVNGHKQKPNTRLTIGDTITLPTGVVNEISLPSTSLPKPNIIFEDDDLLIIEKPTGLAVHSGTSHHQDSVMARVSLYLGATATKPGLKPGLVQRLDRDVSGLLVVGKNAAVLRILTNAVQNDTIDKHYQSLVYGNIADDIGNINIPLQRQINATARQPRMVASDAQNAMPTSTDYFVLCRYQTATLLNIRIHTGLQHQIRAHMLAIGHPIVGDQRYKDNNQKNLIFDGQKLNRPFLHAAELSFSHPRTKQMLRFVSPLPTELKKILKFFKCPV
ncbi:MAG: RluA family pseudouridine synthase [Deltaproteobacteria bacterium]|nr:RluA family pseudouridine synthase [Deltaproteobacteria bacterium]